MPSLYLKSALEQKFRKDNLPALLWKHVLGAISSFRQPSTFCCGRLNERPFTYKYQLRKARTYSPYPDHQKVRGCLKLDMAPKTCYKKLEVISKITKIGNANFLCISFRQCGKTRKSLSPKNILSNQRFSNLFSKTFTFTKFLPKLNARVSERIPVISTLLC